MDSHKYFSVGFQINDDIEDFIEDYENKDFNFAHYKFAVEKSQDPRDIREIKKKFYLHGAAAELYQMALGYFKKSLAIATGVGENTWVQVITRKIKETECVINSIEEYVTIIKTRVSLIQNATTVNSFGYSFDGNSSIEKGLNYVVKEWEKDYPEVKHVMVLSDRENFENEKTVHVADIFQRGILTNNLIDIGRSSKIDLSGIINHEIDYLVQNRNMEGVGCWSYFPTVKEIAPDADDLGQMMQVFIKNGESKVLEDYCLSGIQILLEDCYDEETGGIETWIIPKENPSPNQILQKKFNDTKWGAGPDIDVMANFLYALCLKDYAHYRKVIESGTKYIYTKMEEGCFWNSRWYYGWQYGTMVCVRLGLEVLKHKPLLNDLYSEALSSVKEFIIKNQRKDGGWALGATAETDPLNTSLALSTLMFWEKTYQDSELLEKGMKFLRETQNPDGSWEAISFIKPRLNEPYKSKVITTSYALHALSTYGEMAGSNQKIMSNAKRNTMA
jgi:squalene-hopene/tetraprenyl-beta-curcumene cyclase